MKKIIMPLILLVVIFIGCNDDYHTTQTPVENDVSDITPADIAPSVPIPDIGPTGEIATEVPEVELVINSEQEDNIEYAITIDNAPAPFEGVLDAHNELRRELFLQDLVWNDELAKIAQEQADHLLTLGCQLEHNPNRGFNGENIAMGTYTIIEASDLWAAEESNYNYDDNSCNDVCGHYTQMVQKSTTDIGCGYNADCNIQVCNYSPPGNQMGQKPY